MKIAIRLTILMFSLSVIPLTLLAILSMNEIDQSLEAAELVAMEREIQHQILQMKDRLSFGSEVGLIITSAPSIKNISQIINSEEKSSDANDVLEYEFDRVGDFWKRILEDKNQIQSISFVDLRGFEIIKVYKDENGEIIKSTPHHHSNIFTHVGLVSDMGNLEQGEMFTAIIDAQFQNEQKYLVAHGTPVSVDEKIQGYVVWDSYPDLDIFSVFEDTHIEYHFFDENLFHISSSGNNFLSETYKSGTENLGTQERDSFKREGVEIAYGKFFYNQHDLEKYILVVGITDQHETSILGLVFAISAVIVGIVVFILARFFSHQFLKPIESLTKMSQKLLVGDLTPMEIKKRSDEFGELLTNFNNLTKKLNEFSSEVTRVAREVGREGKLGGQAKVEGVEGKWRELTDTVNELENNLTTQVREIANVTTAVAKGDLSQKVTAEVKGEVLELKNTINTMVDQLNTFSSEVTRVAREVGREGKLGGQAKVEGVEGKWRELTDTVNEFSQNIATPIREIIKMTTAVAGGDLNQEFTADVKGELIKLKQSLNTMTEQLKRVDIARDEFASMVTHELKTPLVPIKGYTQMLMEEGTIGELNQEQYFAVNEIMNNSRRLEKLIEDVMMAHRLEMNQVAFHAKSFNVKEFLGKIPLSFKKMVDDKKIKISTSKVDSKLTGFADTDRLSEVFTNLIQNSVDFVEPIKGVIEIHAKDNGEHIQFSVKDNGLGIPLDKQAQIFKTKFYQVDTSMERKHGGSGLGLVIVKGIVEQGGGKIWFNSKQNEGTEMIFTIPKSWN